MRKKFKGNPLKSTRIYVLTILALILGGIACGAHFYYTNAFVSIDFVNVGQGDAAIITLPGPLYIMIDSGTGSDYANYGSLVERYMTRRGIRRIDAAIVTHYHADHMGAMVELAREGYIERLYLPPADDAPPLHQTLLDAAGDVAVYYMQTDDLLYERPYFSLSVLYIDPKAPDENERSAILLATVQDETVLFTGDMGVETEEAMMRMYDNLDIDYLKVAHHGSRYSTGESWVAATTPQVAIISVGANNYGHPSGEVVSRLEEYGAEVYTTRSTGDYTLRVPVEFEWPYLLSSLVGGASE